MFFSISVPVYNAEKYLDRCINSILSQTFSDFELILVDDGSTDKSLEICNNWKAKFPDKIKVVHKANSGSLFTRRICLFESAGEYLYVMDADDYLIDNLVLSQAKELIDKKQPDLIFFNATANNSGKAYFKFNFENGKQFENDELIDLYKIVISGGDLNPLWNKIFHRDLVDWEEDYSKFDFVTNGTDLFQSLPILFNAKKALYWDKIAYYYQLSNNSSSIIHTFNPNVFRSLKANYLRLCDFCSKAGMEDADIDNALEVRFLKSVSTAVNKIRVAKSSSKDVLYKYIKDIGEDPLFREYYCRKNIVKLPLSRQIILVLLHLRQYRLLIFLLNRIL